MLKAEVINLMEELILIVLTHYYMLLDEKDKMKAIYKIYSKLIIINALSFVGQTKEQSFYLES